MSRQRFEELVGTIAQSIDGRELDDVLADHLNTTWPFGGGDFSELAALCTEGERDGWLVARQAGGIKFGRALKPGGQAGRFSVDVVRMRNVRGPHHVHPNGEIGAVMPVDGAPRFDGFSAGWYVYGPGSEHHPTLTGGDAYVLYLLPEGAIEFTGA